MKEKVKSKIVLEIENKINDILEKEKIELVDIDIFFGKNKHITIYVYKKNKTDLDELSNINKKISPIIESIPDLNNSFILEISSPGINRKIKFKKEFNIFIGREIKIVTNDGTVFNGISNGIKENNLILKDDKNKIISLDINNIKTAYLNA